MHEVRDIRNFHLFCSNICPSSLRLEEGRRGPWGWKDSTSRVIPAASHEIGQGGFAWVYFHLTKHESPFPAIFVICSHHRSAPGFVRACCDAGTSAEILVLPLILFQGAGGAR